MPAIVTTPARRRNDPRSVTRETCEAYINLMTEVDNADNDDAAVLVDDSTSKNYETTYARGERIRLAIRKFNMSTRAIQVRSIETDGEFVAVMRFKD